MSEYCPPECVEGYIRVPVIVGLTEYGHLVRYAEVEEVTCLTCRGFGPRKRPEED